MPGEGQPGAKRRCAEGEAVQPPRRGRAAAVMAGSGGGGAPRSGPMGGGRSKADCCVEWLRALLNEVNMDCKHGPANMDCSPTSWPWSPRECAVCCASVRSRRCFRASKERTTYRWSSRSVQFLFTNTAFSSLKRRLHLRLCMSSLRPGQPSSVKSRQTWTVIQHHGPDHLGSSRVSPGQTSSLKSRPLLAERLRLWNTHEGRQRMAVELHEGMQREAVETHVCFHCLSLPLLEARW